MPKEKPQDFFAKKSGGRVIRRFLLPAALILFISLIMLEIFAPYFYKIVNKRAFDKTELQNKLKSSAARQNDSVDVLAGMLPDWVNYKELHPYVGFTGKRDRSNIQGFTSPEPVLKKSPGQVNICILGGSFAQGLFQAAKDAMAEKLSQSIPFLNKKINIVALALGGYKQPQQLFALLYMLFLGARYDIVINLDGFNEATLPYTENFPHHVFSYYPRSWYMYTSKSLNIPSVLKIAEMFQLRKKQYRLKKKFSGFPLFYSKFSLLLWNTLNNRLENKIRFAQIELDQLIASKNWDSFGESMDKQEDMNQYFLQMAGHWENASLLIQQLARENSFTYFHFLQPTLFFKNSKIATQAEYKFLFTRGNQAHKNAVEKVYSLLLQAGTNLKNNGLIFHDLTGIFKNDSRDLYIDICHLNSAGYEQVADRMISEIILYFQKK